MNFSVSQVMLYISCPFKYKCRYIDGIQTEKGEALIFGSLFHETIENWVKVNEKQLAKDDPKLYSMMMELYTQFNPEGKEFELKVKQPIDGYNFTTIVDALDSKNIDEFKSAFKEWDEQKFIDEVQSAVYIRSEFERTGTWKTFKYWIVTKPWKWKKPKLQTRVIPYYPEKWEFIKRGCDAIIRDFEFNPTGHNKKDGCKFCDFEKYCPAKF